MTTDKRLESISRKWAVISLILLVYYVILTTKIYQTHLSCTIIIYFVACVGISIKNNSGNSRNRRFLFYARPITIAFGMGKPWLCWYYFKKDDSGNLVASQQWKLYVS